MLAVLRNYLIFKHFDLPGKTRYIEGINYQCFIMIKAKGEMVFYQEQDGSAKIDVTLASYTLWLSKANYRSFIAPRYTFSLDFCSCEKLS